MKKGTQTHSDLHDANIDFKPYAHRIAAHWFLRQHTLELRQHKHMQTLKEMFSSQTGKSEINFLPLDICTKDIYFEHIRKRI